MSEHDRGDGSESGQLFRALKGRPTPELDAEGAWRRLEEALGTKRTAGTARPGPAASFPAFRGLRGLAVAAGLVLTVVLGVWIATGGLAGDRQAADLVADDPDVASRPSGAATAAADRPDGPDGPSGPDTALEADVLWAGAAPQEPGPPAAEPTKPEDAGAMLELRLVKGYRGAPSEALLAEAVGEVEDRSGTGAPAQAAGGASPVLDIADRLAGVLEHDGYVLVGRWQGAPPAAGGDVELGKSYRVRLTLAASDAGEPRSAGPDGEDTTRREDDPEPLEIRQLALVETATGRRIPIAAELTLEPDRLYLLGIREAADRVPRADTDRARDADATGERDPELILAVRLLRR